METNELHNELIDFSLKTITRSSEEGYVWTCFETII